MAMNWTRNLCISPLIIAFVTVADTPPRSSTILNKTINIWEPKRRRMRSTKKYWHPRRPIRLSCPKVKTTRPLHQWVQALYVGTPINLSFDTGAVPNFVWSNVLDPIWLDSIRQPDIPEIWCAYNTRFTAPRNITLHLQLGELCTRFKFDILSKLTGKELLGTISIERAIKLINPDDKKNISHYFPPIPILMDHKASCVPKNKRTRSFPFKCKTPGNIGTALPKSKLRPTTVVRQVVVKAMCEIALVVCA